MLFAGKRSKTWYFQKDVGGQTKRILIGRHPTISADAARKTALGLSLDMSRGAGRQVRTGAPLLKDAIEGYLARPRLRSEAHKHGLRSQLHTKLRDWLRLPLDEISKSMVVERHRVMAKVPSAANNTFRQFRTIWNHARRTHDLPESPTMAIEWYPEEPDGRMIDNLGAWQAAVDRLENPIHAPFYRLLLFTGLRKTEAFTLEWKNVHKDRLHLPMTKNGRSFDLPIVEPTIRSLSPFAD